MSSDLVCAMVKKARPVVIAHMTSSAYLVTGHLPQKRGTGPRPCCRSMAVPTSKAAVGAHQVGVVPGGIRRKADIG